MMNESGALKHYFDGDLARHLSGLIKQHCSDFPSETFINCVINGVEGLELKARVSVIAEHLHQALPPDYPDALNLLLSILGPENETEQGMFTNGYYFMPVAHFVEKYGLPHFELSMKALYEITKRHTSEYAIRPFLQLYPEDCLHRLRTWMHDPNLHVRRLVSEGTRPRLPWAKRIDVIQGDIENNLSLLEPLLNDPSFYVRKSVANHLNDLTKYDKLRTLEWLDRQMGSGGDHFPWIVKHAVRSLVKSGDGEAMGLLEKAHLQYS